MAKENVTQVSLAYNRTKLSENESKALRLYMNLDKHKSQTLLDLILIFSRDYNVPLDDPEMFTWNLIGAKRKILDKTDSNNACDRYITEHKQ